MKKNRRLNGLIIKSARVLAGLTQRQLADLSGVHSKSIARMEKLGAQYSPLFGAHGALRPILVALKDSGVDVDASNGTISCAQFAVEEQRV